MISHDYDIMVVWIRPDGIGTVLHEERDNFIEIKDRLRYLIEKQIAGFRFVSLFLS